MIRFARVVATHPPRRTLDLVDLNSGVRMLEAHYAGSVGAASGTWDVPKAATAGGQNAPAVGANLIAAYALNEFRQPVVLGFVRPQGSLMTFADQDRTITRHDSGTYYTIEPDGSYEVWQAGGGYFRIGAGGHQAIAGFPAGAGAAPEVTLATATFSLHVSAAGDATMTYNTLTLNGPVTLNGTLTATGDVKAGTISLENHVHKASGTNTTPPIA